MTWQIDLLGDPTDVAEIAKIARLSDCSIENGPDGRPCLSSSKFSEFSDATEVSAAAERVLQLLNGIARTRHSDHEPVRLGSAVSRTNTQGGRDITVLLEGAAIRVRGGDVMMKITRSDGSVEVDRASDLFESRAKKILADARLQEIAEAIAGAISWQRLRVVFEKLSTLVGSGDNQLVSQGYATQAELTRFKANIEDPRLSGLNAVHGVPRGPLKGTPLSLAEGLGFVTKLINDYLDRN